MKVAIREIKPNTNNPRFIKDDKFRKLVKSIKEFPEMLELRPIVVDSDMVVLGGNMRLKACIEAGLTEVPILVADQLTEEQKKEFIVKDNVGFGEWDWDLLANEWDTDLLEEWGLDLNIDVEQDESFATDVTVTLKMNNEYLDELKEDLDKLLAKHTNIIVKIK
jgi:ParB-like chromosome segregation protein Spo0J